MSTKQSIKILVIEDNQDVRENLIEILELSNFTVLAAEDGLKGVEIAQTQVPDLILCDVMMPKLDGFGVLNILGKRPDTSGIPFVFLTAKAERSDFRRGMNLGADDYVTKPFYKDELLSVIETRLRKTKLLRKDFDRSESGLRAFINEAKGFEALKNLSNDKKVKHFFFSKNNKNYSEKTLEKLYLKAIENRFDLMLLNSEIYFEPITMINSIKSKINVPNFKFLSQRKLEKKAFTENRQLRIISMAYDQSSKDTIDVYFPIVSLTVKQEGKVRKASYKLVTEKSNDFYIRLVYMKNDEWKIIHNGFVKN